MPGILSADDATRLAERLLAARYPDADAAFAAGSFIRGGATALSDLDIIVLHAALPNARRESFIFEGVPVDGFIHDPETLRAFLQKDVDAGKPAMLTMVREGRIIGPRPEAATELLAEADAIHAKGPLPWTQERLDLGRYLITSRIEDLQDHRPWPELVATAAWLHLVLADFILNANGRWAATGKWVPRTLAAFDPAVEAVYTAAFDAIFERRDPKPLIAFAEQTLAPFGGFLFDGFTSNAEPKERIQK
jgi:predicted nucleotidyltransferase